LAKNLLAFRLEEEDEELIEDWAKKTGLPKSAIIRIIIRSARKRGLWIVLREATEENFEWR